MNVYLITLLKLFVHRLQQVLTKSPATRSSFQDQIKSFLLDNHFYDECLEGASIITDVLDFNEEPFEMRCTDTGDFKGWRVGARLPPGSASWYEEYEGFSVRANFADWDFNIIQKYSGALEMQPDQATN